MSRLLAIELENFMSIKWGRAEFDDSNILNLCGYNDSGKSAFTRANEIMFYNAYSSEQSNYITDGEDYFLIRHIYDDGVVIERIKNRGGSSEFYMFKDNAELFSNKLANGTIAVNGIPKVINDYLGVLEDEHTGEKLNVRRNTDRLFLINTTGGDNYKILNTVLRSDVLAESSKRLNNDRNKLQTELANLNNTHDTLKGQLSTLNILDDSLIGSLKDNISNLASKRVQVEYLVSVNNSKLEYDELQIYDELVEVDTRRLTSIITIADQYVDASRVVYDECDRVETGKVKSLLGVANALKESLIDSYDECDIVDITRYKAIKDLCSAYNDLWQCENELVRIDNELKVINTQMAEMAKDNNYKICKNCGSLVM